MAGIEIFDTTIRDGGQGIGINFSVEDALNIARKLDQSGVSYIEGGWPGSNPTDVEFFQRAKKELRLVNAKLVAFGATRQKGIKVEDDESIKKILESGVSVAAIFGKNSAWQVKHTLKTSLQENLRMINDTVSYLASNSIEVIYDAEHFFNGYLENPEYALKALETAYEAGAGCLVLCDTNGGMLYDNIEGIVTEVTQELAEKFGGNIKIGIHCHNDSGNAVANTQAAVLSGATHVQGTINGIGERCGNANLCTIIPNLILKMKIGCFGISKSKLKELKSLSDFVYGIANREPDDSQPYVGDNAFTHKGGVHASGFMRNPGAYAHIDPSEVGNRQKIATSRLAGRSTVIYQIQEMGLKATDEQVSQILKDVKSREARGYHYEVAEGSRELLFLKALGVYHPLFALEEYRTEGGSNGFVKKKKKLGKGKGSAILIIQINGQRIVEDGKGDGQVNALDIALRKALKRAYPDFDHFELRDYKVSIVKNKELTGTASVTRVLLEVFDRKKNKSFWTVGVSTDVIGASWEALVDGYTRAMVPYILKHNGND